MVKELSQHLIFHTETSKLICSFLFVVLHKPTLLPSTFKTTLSQKSISYSGPLLWNQLPKDIGKCFSLHSFKSKLKTYLILNPSFDIDYGVWLCFFYDFFFLFFSLFFFFVIFTTCLSILSFLSSRWYHQLTPPPPTNNPTCRLSSL